MKNRIRELRVARSWTQATLGDALGVSRQTINAIEKGRYDPSLPLAFKFSALFNEPIEALFTPELDAKDGLGDPAVPRVGS